MKRPEISLTVMEPDFSDTSEPDDDVNVRGRKEAKRFQVKEACWPCRKAKRACAGERPCPRCKERNLDCQDVPHQMRGPRGRPKGSKALDLESESAGMPGREMLAMHSPIQKSSRNVHQPKLKPKPSLPSLQVPIGLDRMPLPPARSSSSDLRSIADSATDACLPQLRRYREVMIKVAQQHEPVGWRGYATIYMSVWIASKRLKEKQSTLCHDFERTLDWAREIINRFTFTSVKQNSDALFDDYFERSLENLTFPVIRYHRDSDTFLPRAVYYNRAMQTLLSTGSPAAMHGPPFSRRPFWTYLLPRTMLDLLIAEVEALNSKRSTFRARCCFQLDSGAVMSATLHMNLGFSSGGAPIVTTIFLLDVTEVAHTEFPQGSGASIMSLIQDDSATQANKDGAKDGKIVDLLHRMLARQHSPQTPKSQWGGTFGHPGEREQEEHELHLHYGDSSRARHGGDAGDGIRDTLAEGQDWQRSGDVS